MNDHDDMSGSRYGYSVERQVCPSPSSTNSEGTRHSYAEMTGPEVGTQVNG